VSFETYKEWYKNTIMVNPIDFEKLTDNRYQFKVELQDNNQNQELYRVIMEVNEGKIIPISSEEIVAGPISFGNVTAFVIQKQLGFYEFKTHLMLSENGKEQVLDEELSNDGAGKRFFGPLEFSPKGNYLISPIAGYEWYGANIYDVKDKKRVLELSIPLITNFTPSEKYFFACAENGLGGGYYAKIYSVPDFEEIYDVSIKEGNYNISVDCRYDKEEHVIRLRVDSESRTEGSERKIVEFSETAGELKVINKKLTDKESFIIDNSIILELINVIEDENIYQHYLFSIRAENIKKDGTHNLMCKKNNEDFLLKEFFSYSLPDNLIEIYNLSFEPNTNYVCYMEECFEDECRKSNELSFKTFKEYLTMGGAIDVLNRIYIYNDEQYVIGEDVEVFIYNNKINLKDICLREDYCSDYWISLHVLFNEDGDIVKIFYTPQ
ncbi:MAG: hypothetical protein WCR93_04250, partial [Bacilli bacterium]